MGCLPGLAVVAVAAVAAASWVFSSSLLDPDHSAGPFGIAVERVEVRDDGDGGASDVIAFERDEISERPGIYGLDFEDGHAIAHQVVVAGPAEAAQPGDEVSRKVTEIEGDLDEGDKVAFDPTVWETNPLAARGIPYREVDYASQLGPMPAWRVNGNGVEGRGKTWAIFVHGHNATRAAGLRILKPLHRAGLPSLLIAYRNDPGAPPSEDGLLHLGATEWKDLDAAARYALEHGARDLVVVGSSMGGAIVSQFIHRSPRAARVRALIFDAPVLDWKAVIDLQASERGLPGPIATSTEWTVSGRIDFDWDAFDQIARADEFGMPILLFHGDQDETVPISSSEQFAAKLPGQVTFYEVPEAGHVEAWNVGPKLFDQRVLDFLAAALAPGAASSASRPGASRSGSRLLRFAPGGGS